MKNKAVVLLGRYGLIVSRTALGIARFVLGVLVLVVTSWIWALLEKMLMSDRPGFVWDLIYVFAPCFQFFLACTIPMLLLPGKKRDLD